MYIKSLPVLLVSILLLSACNQSNQQSKANDPAAFSIKLSSNNATDIEDDLKRLDAVANQYSAAMANMQDIINTALENNDTQAFTVLYDQLEQHTHAFNKGLDEADFKSQEISNIAQQFKDSHLLGLELTQEQIKDKPDQTVIHQLKERLGTQQQNIVDDIRKLQMKAYMTKDHQGTAVTSVKTEQQAQSAEAKKSNTHQVLSQNNTADIQKDLYHFFATSHEAQQRFDSALSAMGEAAQQGKSALNDAAQNTKRSLIDLNAKYDAVVLASEEVSKIRNKMKQAAHIQIELCDIILLSVPDKQRSAMLQQQRSELYNQIRLDLEALQQKVAKT